jgi:hypothetical protein
MVTKKYFFNRLFRFDKNTENNIMNVNSKKGGAAMANGMVVNYECEMCGSEIVVTSTGESRLSPIYCCGVEVTRISSVDKKPKKKAVKKVTKRVSKKKATKKKKTIAKKKKSQK